MKRKHKIIGFTLIEMMLVLVIASSLMVLFINVGVQKTQSMQRERVAVTMQQILSAALAYYVVNGAWPSTGIVTSTSLVTGSPAFLPASGLGANLYHNAFTSSINSTTGTFSVSTTLLSNTASTTNNAMIIASLIPLGVSVGKVITGQVNIPGQNLNNAMGANFAGMYMTGGCVPAPACPLNMTPAIYVIPASVAGMVNPPASCTGSDASQCTGVNPAAITSYGAFAVGNSANAPDIAANIKDCAVINSPSTGATCQSASTDSSSQKYWRVCLSVTTINGMVDPNTTQANNKPYALQQAQLMGNVIAFTRCVPNSGTDKPSGTPTLIWNTNVNNRD